MLILYFHLSTAAASVSYSLAGPAPVLSVTDGPAPVLTLFAEAQLGFGFLTGNADFFYVMTSSARPDGARVLDHPEPPLEGWTALNSDSLSRCAVLHGPSRAVFHGSAPELDSDACCADLQAGAWLDRANFFAGLHPGALLDCADLRSDLHTGTLLDRAALCAGLHPGTTVFDHSQLILRVLCILCVLSLWLDANLLVARARRAHCSSDSESELNYSFDEFQSQPASQHPPIFHDFDYKDKIFY